MTLFTIYDSALLVPVRCGSVANYSDAMAQAGNGEALLVGVAVSSATYRIAIQNGLPVPILLAPTSPSLDDLKASSKAEVAQRRWEIECGGILINGMTVATDDRSKVLITSAYMRATSDASFTARWKAVDGSWVQLNAAQLIGIYGAMFSWVDQCFAREGVLDDMIQSQTTVEAVGALRPAISKFWP